MSRASLVIWGGVFLLVALDASIATPLGVTLLYFVPVTAAAFYLPARQVLAMALLCAVARLLFGPLADPLSLHQYQLIVSPGVEQVVNAIVSVVAYLGAAFVLTTLVRQRRAILAWQHASHTDPLTALPNRRALEAFLDAHQGVEGVVLAADLDHFKRVNDEHGHAAGDRVLEELSRRLRAQVRGDDLVVRAGGEEFLLLLPRAGPEVAARICEAILLAVRGRPFELEGGSLSLTVSIGAAVGPLEEPLLVRADEALYAVKRAGRDAYRLAAEATPAPA